jgi:hypothetical protein
MQTDTNTMGSPRKAWTAPVLTQLTVDLTQIANSLTGGGDGPGVGNAARKS